MVVVHDWLVGASETCLMFFEVAETREVGCCSMTCQYGHYLKEISISMRFTLQASCVLSQKHYCVLGRKGLPIGEPVTSARRPNKGTTKFVENIVLPKSNPRISCVCLSEVNCLLCNRMGRRKSANVGEIEIERALRWLVWYQMMSPSWEIVVEDQSR